MVRRYLDSDQAPMAMLLLMDLRRGPEAEERVLFEALFERGIRGVGVLTKADKLVKSKRKIAKMHISKDLAEFSVPLFLFSSKTGEGKETLWRAIERTFQSSAG